MLVQAWGSPKKGNAQPAAGTVVETPPTPITEGSGKDRKTKAKTKAKATNVAVATKVRTFMMAALAGVSNQLGIEFGSQVNFNHCTSTYPGRSNVLQYDQSCISEYNDPFADEDFDNDVQYALVNMQPSRK